MYDHKPARVFTCSLFTCSLAAWMVLVLASTAFAGLTTDQQKLLQSAQHYAKNAQTNLKSAQDSAGPPSRKPTGSRAKLAMMRVSSARGDMKNALAALAKLPADDTSVVELQKQLGLIKQGIEALETRLTGKPAGPTEEPVGKKLDYKQEEKLKAAHFSLREMDGWANALDKLIQQVDAAPNKELLDHRELAKGMATIDKCRQRHGYVMDALEMLPKDGRGVSQAYDSLTKVTKRITASNQSLTPVHKRLQEIISPASYPNLHTDVRRVRELSSMIGSPTLMMQDPTRAASVIEQAPAAKKEVLRVLEEYGLLIHQKTELSKAIDGATKSFVSNFTDLVAEVNKQKQSLPQAIEKDLAEVKRMAEEAVAKKIPGYFAGGIPQNFGWAEDKLALYKVLEPNLAGAVEQKIKDTRALMKKHEAGLRDQIIATNTLPPDQYHAEDRDAWTKTAIAAWKEKQPNAEILKARIPSKAWKRETMWRLQNTTWYRIDRSKLQIQLLVKHDTRLAAIRPINIWIDHQSGDAVTAFPMHEDPKEELPARSYLPIEKVK